MDNVKYYNDSLAYDFAMFMPRTNTAPRERENDNVVKLPKTVAKVRTRKKTAVRRLSASAFAVLTSIMVLAALFGNIFLRLRINEVNSQINDVKSQIEVARSERTRLSVEFEREISFSNIELEATEMGMRKRDQSQIKYIRVNKNNTVEKGDGNTVNSKD